METYDIVVIGGGPAGITLAKMLGQTNKMAIIRPEDHSMIYCAMPYALEGLLDGEKTLKRDGLVTDAGADLLRKTATKVDFDTKIVSFSDSSQIGYDKLVIATGATPFIPPIPGSELAGVTGFKTADDFNHISKRLEAGLSRAVVVGAGAIGIELALALKARGADVDLVDMADSILPNLLDQDMSEPLCAELARAGVRLHLRAKATELRGTKAVEQVVLDNGQVIHFDSLDNCTDLHKDALAGLVVFAAGMKPTIDLVTDSSMTVGRGGITVNAKMETNIPDVYAVGDCAEFTSGITHEIVPGKLATNAVPMAKVLGWNLLGQERTYPGFFNGAATKIADAFAGGTGLSEVEARRNNIEPVCGHSEVTTQFPIMPEAKKLRVKLIVDPSTRRLIGGQIVSGEPVTGRLDLLTFAIQKQATVDDLAQLSYAAQPYQSFYPAANGVALAAEDVIAKLR